MNQALIGCNVLQGTTLMRSPEWEVFTCMRVATCESIRALSPVRLIQAVRAFKARKCMGTYVIEGVELDNKVKMVLGDRQQPPRSQKLTD